MTASATPPRPVDPRAGTRGDGAWSTALSAAYGSRVIVWVAAMLALALWPPSHGIIASFDPAGITQPFHAALLNRLFAPAARYDSVWYLQIAQHGYFTDQARAFFPLYPLLIGIVAQVVHQPLIIGLLISLVCFSGALVLLMRLAALDLPAPAARLSVWLMALFPMSLFFSAIYTEALFTLLSIWSIYAARTERWWLAGVTAALASAARSDGVVLIVPLVWIYLWGPRPSLTGAASPTWRHPSSWRPLKRPRADILWLLLTPIGLIAYLAYCAADGSTFTAPFHAAAFYWGRSFQGPFSEIWTAIGHGPRDIGRLLTNTNVSIFDNDDPLNWTWDNVIDIVWIVPVLLALVAAWRRLPKVYVLYTVLIIVASASNPSPLEPMMSFARYVMPAFPLMMGAAAALVDRPVARWGTLIVSGAALAFFSALWGIWAWVA